MRTWLNPAAATLSKSACVAGLLPHAVSDATVNIHHDGGDSAHWLDIKGAATDSVRNAEVTAQFAAMWTQIARRFADKGDFLMFEAVNEIHDGVRVRRRGCRSLLRRYTQARRCL